VGLNLSSRHSVTHNVFVGEDSSVNANQGFQANLTVDHIVVGERFLGCLTLQGRLRPKVLDQRSQDMGSFAFEGDVFLLTLPGQDCQGCLRGLELL
jgi:hypothetical protein